MIPRTRALGLAFLALVSFTLPAAAQWIPNGGLVSPATGKHWQPFVVPDGRGGAFIVWQESVGATAQEVFVTRLLADGSTAEGFPATGAPVAGTAAARRVVGAGSDGSGGVVIGWNQSDDGFAKRVQPDGTPAAGWSPDGNLVSAEPGWAMAGDGTGGGWFHLRDDGMLCPDICSQWSSQSVRYFGPGGVPSASELTFAASSHQYGSYGRLHASDGGFLLMDGGDGYLYEDAVRRVAAPYQQSWSFPLDMSHLVVRAALDDGAGGGLVVTEGALGSLPPRLLRIGPAGALYAGWPAGGAPIRVPDVAMAGVTAVGGGAGATIVGWIEQGAIGAQVRVQKLTGTGAVAAGWPADGVVACDGPSTPDLLVLAPDGSGGAFLAWRDRRNEGAGDAYAHHVLAGGGLDPEFAVNGTGIATLPGGVEDLAIAPVSTGAAMLAWTDHRTGTEVRAQMLPLPGTAGADPGGAGRFALAGFTPNPSPGFPRVAFTLARPGDARLELFDVTGRRVHDERLTGLVAGPHSLALAPARPLAPGLYLIRLRAGGESRVRRGLVGH